jgi:hypothetical protein
MRVTPTPRRPPTRAPPTSAPASPGSPIANSTLTDFGAENVRSKAATFERPATHLSRSLVRESRPSVNAMNPPTVAEVVAVVQIAGDGLHGRPLRGLTLALSRADPRIDEALALREADLDP